MIDRTLWQCVWTSIQKLVSLSPVFRKEAHVRPHVGQFFSHHRQPCQLPTATLKQSQSTTFLSLAHQPFSVWLWSGFSNYKCWKWRILNLMMQTCRSPPWKTSLIKKLSNGFLLVAKVVSVRLPQAAAWVFSWPSLGPRWVSWLCTLLAYFVIAVVFFTDPFWLVLLCLDVAHPSGFDCVDGPRSQSQRCLLSKNRPWAHSDSRLWQLECYGNWCQQWHGRNATQHGGAR